MCGISFTLSPQRIYPSPEDIAWLSSRGPDYLKVFHAEIDAFNLVFSSSVLHIRGDVMTRQPVISSTKILQWNGEIFDGIQVPGDSSDTSILFTLLEQSNDVTEIISKVKGPFAFVFCNLEDRCIWFGRDCFGRRSLVFKTDPLSLSSVIPFGDHPGLWHEARVDGIYKYSWDSAVLELIPIPYRASFFKISRSLEPVEHPVECALLALEKSLMRRLPCSPHAVIGVLFSGGVDSCLITALLDDILPVDVEIDLYNVAFIGQDSHVPDRETGRRAFTELKARNSQRTYRFIQIDIIEETYRVQKEEVKRLLAPQDTVLDMSIGMALWFAASGRGYLAETDECTKLPYQSRAKILYMGSGADEQFGGYSRHRSAWECKGHDGLVAELQLDLDRLPFRNMGRDDRCLSAHGREVRFPFLDETFVQYISNLPISAKMDFTLARGLGEKRLLRLMALKIGLSEAIAFAPKRAIQFGSKVTKMEKGPKRKGGDSILS